MLCERAAMGVIGRADMVFFARFGRMLASGLRASMILLPLSLWVLAFVVLWHATTTGPQRTDRRGGTR